MNFESYSLENIGEEKDFFHAVINNIKDIPLLVQTL